MVYGSGVSRRLALGSDTRRPEGGSSVPIVVQRVAEDPRESQTRARRHKDVVERPFTLIAVELDVVFLGTSGSMPTAKRAPSATLVRRGGDRLLFDCAEGTQRQLLRSDVGLAELEEVFLTHYHADHYLGLPGMLKTFAFAVARFRSRSTVLGDWRSSSARSSASSAS